MSQLDQVHLMAVMLFMSETVIIFNIHRIWWYGWKAWSLSFPKLFLDWKLKLWTKMCVDVLFPSLTSLTYIALHPLCVLYLSLTSLTLLWSFVQYSMHSMLCISTPPTSNNVHWHAPFNVHTTDKVTMGDNWCEWVASSLSNSKWVSLLFKL